MVALCHFFCVPGLGRIDNNDKERSLMMKFYLILLLAVGYMCSKAFKFEKVSRLEAVTLPFYAFWMFLANFTWNWKNVGIMCALCIVAVCLGWYQTRDAELKETTRFGKHGRPIKLLKKGKAYNIGWFLVFLVGIMLEAVAEHGIGFQMILEKLQEEVERDLFIFKYFSTGSTWYLWELSAVSNLACTYFLEKKFPNLRTAFKRTSKTKTSEDK